MKNTKQLKALQRPLSDFEKELAASMIEFYENRQKKDPQSESVKNALAMYKKRIATGTMSRLENY